MKFISMIKPLSAALVGGLFLATSAQAATVKLSSIDNGWYNNAGNHSSINTNIFTGSLGASEYKSFFLFDLSSVTGPVTSATLTIDGGNGSNTVLDAPVTVTFNDVVTDLDALRAGTGSTSAFDDLGGGATYATASLGAQSSSSVMPTVSAALSAPSALIDINAASGGLFAIGAFITNPSGAIWSSSANRRVGVATLSLNVVSPVPVPATLPLLALGLVGFGVVARRKKAA